MTFLTACEIRNAYPEGIEISAYGVDTYSGMRKYGAMMYMLKDGFIHKTLLELSADFKTPEEAEEFLHKEAQEVVEFVNKKLNNELPKEEPPTKKTFVVMMEDSGPGSLGKPARVYEDEEEAETYAKEMDEIDNTYSYWVEECFFIAKTND